MDLAQVLAEGPSALKVDPWKKFKHGKSLYNPKALGELGTQMYLLNKWYMRHVNGERTLFLLELETNITSVAMTLYMSSLENYTNYAIWTLYKSLISCYCL